MEDDEGETPLYRTDTTFLEESEFNPPIKKSKIKKENEKIQKNEYGNGNNHSYGW